MKRKTIGIILIFALISALLPVQYTTAFDVAEYDSPQTISIGSYSRMAVMDDNTLWYWGGHLWSLDSEATEEIRTPVKSMENVISVSCGDRFNLALKEDGTLWMWGFMTIFPEGSSAGIFGAGSAEGRRTNFPVKIMEDVAAASASDSGDYALIIKKDRSLWAFGENIAGRFGDGTTLNRSYSNPVKVMDDVACVSAGSYHAAAVKTDGTLWTWGFNTKGERGNGETSQYELTPYKVMDGAKSVAVGHSYTMALKADGSLWAWGDNVDGQLGCGEFSDYILYPCKVMDGVRSISAGGFSSFAIKDDGSLWAWGGNYSGQLGVGPSINKTAVPLKVMDGIKAVAGGGGMTLAFKTDGSLWAWGNNTSGEIGDGTVADLPKKITDGIVSVASGESHTLAIKTDGSLWAWGGNTYGQIGDGTKGIRESDNLNDEKHSPVKILENVKSADGGQRHSLAVKSDGSLWVWGANHQGQLGIGKDTDYSPSPVKLMEDVTAVSAAGYISAAIKSDNSLWVWGGTEGSGYDLRIWGGDTSPVPVKLMDGVKAVSLGAQNSNFHLMALKTDGSLWACGDNFYGQLGDGTREYRNSPVKVMDGVDAVFTGEDSTFVIKTDGSLWAWGKNNRGELGVETQYNYSITPLKVMDNISTVSSGMAHTLIVDKSGDLYACGYNDSGQLGDGTIKDSDIPINIMENIKSVATGQSHSIALKNDGSLWVWGANWYGQLGDGLEGKWRIQYTPKKILIMISSGTAAVPKAGTVLGDVLYSDITAYINGHAIPTSVINGRTLVVVEDLANYGFDIIWNGNNRTLKVELNKGKEITPLKAEKSTNPVGTFKCKYVYTDIKTYLSGELVESFAIDGVTLIDFDVLGKYGKFTWDNQKREIRLVIDWLIEK